MHLKYSELKFSISIQNTPHIETSIQHEGCFAIYMIEYRVYEVNSKIDSGVFITSTISENPLILKILFNSFNLFI